MADSGMTFSYARLAIAKDQKQSPLLKFLQFLAGLAIAEEQKQIRLLKLVPSLDTDRISCTLEVVNWTPRLQYAAISYVWGDPRKKKAIYIDDQPFHITENLYTALWHIRKNDMLRQDGSEQPLPLWADAVCINQDSIEERNHQVPMMGSIYGSASKVIYWVGRLEDDRLSGDAAITAIQEMADAAFHDGSDLDTQSLQHYLAAHEGLTALDTPNHDVAPFGDLPLVWQSILHIFSHEFWERIWIIQEIALPGSHDNLLFTCGNSTATWTRLSQFFEIVHIIKTLDGALVGLPESAHHHLTTMFMLSRGMGYVSVLRGFRNRDNHMGPETLPVFATMYRATNSLDYVYGFRAVLHVQPAVDYEKSKKEVYMDWFKDAMRYKPVSALVLYAGVGLLGPANQEWPSWLPDLASLRVKTSTLATRTAMVDGILYSQQPSGKIDGNVLHVSGLRLGDTVAKIFKPGPGAPKREDGYIPGFIHYVCFDILANASSHHLLGVTTLQAFLITVVDCFGIQTNSKLSFEHPLDSNDPMLIGLVFGTIFYNWANHSNFSHDDYLSTYGPGWVSMGLRNRDDLVDNLQEQFLGTCDRFPGYTLHRFIVSQDQQIALFEIQLQKYTTFQTTNGHIGIGPPGTKEGDELCFLSGHATPMLLRLEKENDSMVTKFVGVCYIHESSVAVMKDSIASGSAKYERLPLH